MHNFDDIVIGISCLKNISFLIYLIFSKTFLKSHCPISKYVFLILPQRFFENNISITSRNMTIAILELMIQGVQKLIQKLILQMVDSIQTYRNVHMLMWRPNTPTKQLYCTSSYTAKEWQGFLLLLIARIILVIHLSKNHISKIYRFWYIW